MSRSPIFSRSHLANESEPPSNLASWYTPGLSDALGDRLLMFDNTTASSLELLRFKQEFSDAPEFEAALRQRMDELRRFDHPSFARARTVQWLGDGEGLALVSNHLPGRRLSEILHEARGARFAAELIRQITPLLAALQRQGGGIAHGALTPERIIVTPEGRLVLAEYVLGSALESLHLPPTRLQSEFGLAVPPEHEHLVADPRLDVVQLGYMALSLLVGRPVSPTEDPERLARLLERPAGSRGGATPAHLRSWLHRALQLGEPKFDSARDAHKAIAEWPDESELEPDPVRTLLEFRPAAESRNAVASNTPPPDTPDSDFDFPDEEQLDRPVVVTVPAAFARGDRPASPASPRGDEAARASAKATARDRQVTPAKPPADRVEPFRHQKATPARETDKSAAARDASRSRTRGWVIGLLATLSILEAAAITVLLVTRPTPGALASAVDTRRPAPEPATATAPPVVPAAKPDTPATPGVVLGRLEIASDPVGARVAVDGTPRGATPITISVDPGEHTVVITAGSATTRRTVTVTAGSTSTLMASLGPIGTAGGWIAFDAPLDLQVSEGGSLLGSTKASRIMLPTGRHQLELASAALGFQDTLAVDIEAGKTVSARVTVPNGSLSVNALPWANVWLDNQSLGTTPFANLQVPIGTHEVIWRHPQFGERRQSVVVTARAPVRVVMDLSKP